MKTCKVLVTGGCGYIGSHTAIDLLKQGFEVVSIDSLERSQAFVAGR
ncbi:MAG TPA: GDP-mannose 4,6-dehydratase, partial [Chitinophagales bacterium]|nr:GDP-mannose 4,6-dehydratase [Chitinophagales bacterium]